MTEWDFLKQINFSDMKQFMTQLSFHGTFYNESEITDDILKFCCNNNEVIQNFLKQYEPLIQWYYCEINQNKTILNKSCNTCIYQASLKQLLPWESNNIMIMSQLLYDLDIPFYSAITETFSHISVKEQDRCKVELIFAH
jgi:hypothetical protein